MSVPELPAPTDGLGGLALAARVSRVAASVLRWFAACAIVSAALLALSIALAMIDRGAPVPAQPSASAYLDFDLAVLRSLADRSLGAAAADGTLRSLWARRPAWSLPPAPATGARLVSPRDAWAASVAERSRFRSAARGVFDALGLLLSGLGLALLAAAAGGAVAERARWTVDGRAAVGRLALAAAAALLIVLPLWRLLDPALFYDRTRSVGAGFAAALFVAAFAGAMSGAAARALFAPPAQAGCLSALAGRPALLSAARLSALDATQWLVPLVPALAAAAVFACAKADQDPSIQGISSGLGSLIRAAMREASVGERLSSAALVGGALLVLWALGHRFVTEVRVSLGSVGSAR